MIMRGVSELEWMLDHELLLAERYRRFVSVTMIKSKVPAEQKQVLADTIRESDVYFEFSDSFGAILMSETDGTGALAAVERYKQSCGADTDIRFAVGSYPQDHQPAPKFLSTVYQRMKSAEALEPGAVVTTD